MKINIFIEENPQPLKANFRKEKSKIVIFSDSIPRGIRLREFNCWLHKGYAQLKSFPGGTSKELLYYVEPTLKNKKFDDALLHAGVNDLEPRLCPKSPGQLEANWFKM